MSNVVHLADVAPFAVTGDEGLADWLQSYVDAIRAGTFRPLRSLSLVVEADDGAIALASTSTSPHHDRARLIGLLQYAIHNRIEGNADIGGLAR